MMGQQTSDQPAILPIQSGGAHPGGPISCATREGGPIRGKWAPHGYAAHRKLSLYRTKLPYLAIALGQRATKPFDVVEQTLGGKAKEIEAKCRILMTDLLDSIISDFENGTIDGTNDRLCPFPVGCQHAEFTDDCPGLHVHIDFLEVKTPLKDEIHIGRFFAFSTKYLARFDRSFTHERSQPVKRMVAFACGLYLLD
jgi:hypothetical protein